MTDNNAKKSFNRIGFALLAGTLAIIVVGLLAAAPLSNAENLQRLVDAIGPSLTLLLTFVPNILFLLVFWLVVRTMPRAEWRKEEMSFKELLQIFVMMYAVSTLINIFGISITKISPAGKTQSLELIDSVVTSGLPIGIVMVSLIAPVIEELVFRKLMIDRIRDYGEMTAIVFSALCFGLFHGNLTQFLYAFSVGIFLGYVYCKTGKVLITIIMHALLNGCSSFVMLLVPLMEKGVDKAILLLVPAVLIITVLLISGWIVLIRWLKHRRFRADNAMPTCIPKHEVLETVGLNPGVSLFVLYSAVSIVLKLVNINLF